MTTFTIELDDKLAHQIEATAQQNGLSSENWLRAQIEIALTKSISSISAPEAASDAEFETVAQRAIARDAELLQRLAQ